MNPSKKPFRVFSLRARLESFRYACSGLRVLLVTQHNAWIHLLCTAIAVVVGFYLSLSINEWIAVILSIAIVWMAEALNTAMEFLSDATIPEFHPLVEKAKDVAAGAVLISALAAFATAGLIVASRMSP